MNFTNKRKSILIVEDDMDIADLIDIYLRNQDYQTYIAYNLKDASALLEQKHPDLILCDIMLPDGNGKTWIQNIKLQKDLPTIFLSSLKETEDIIDGLELAEDYITKPFDPDIMVARVKSHLRRATIETGITLSSTATVYRDGWLDLNFDHFEVKVNGEEISLPVKELHLLFHMATRPGHVFSAEHLFDRIWGVDSWSDVRTVMVHIHNLRRKIEEQSGSHRYITTVRGIGYKFQIRSTFKQD